MNNLLNYKLICDKCFRLIYISFNYIKEYISTHCLYCKKIAVYKYDSFYDKFKGNDLLLNTPCFKCNKFLNSKNLNQFYLIEESENRFLFICDKCKNEENEIIKNKKIINITDLINIDNTLYENNNNDFNVYFKNVELNITKLQKYEEYVSLIEKINKNTPISLKIKANHILQKLKNILKCINLITENFRNSYKLMILHNIISSISILNPTFFESHEINNNYEYNISESYEIIKNFIDSEKLLLSHFYIPEFDLPQYSCLTKNYSNKEEYIKDKNKPKEEILEKSYLDILNINFETGETIFYNILANYFFAEKIVPIYYNYNKSFIIDINNNDINYQEILIYNRKNDKNLYYGIYDIKYSNIVIDSLIPILNDDIYEINKLILLNYGKDLFFVGKLKKLDSNIFCFYMTDFRNGKFIDKYELKESNFDNIEIIYKETDIIIKTEKILYLINSLFKKEQKIPKEKIKVLNPNNKISYLFLNSDNKLILSKCIEIISIMERGIEKIIFIMKGFYNCFKKRKLDNINNFLTDPGDIKYVQDKISNSQRYYEYTIYRKLFYLNDDYFLVISSQHFEFGVLKSFFYLNLYSFKRFELITKIEIDKFLSESDEFSATIGMENLIIKIEISSNNDINYKRTYFFKFENQELFLISN